MCIVMLRILNFSYINGKSNDLYEEINKKPEVQQPRNREIRSTIFLKKLATIMVMEEVVQSWSHY